MTIFNVSEITETVTESVIKDAVEAVNVEPDEITEFIIKLPDNLMKLGMRVFISAVILVVGLWLINILRGIVKTTLRKTTNVDKSLRQFIDSFLKISLRILLVLFIATRFGMETATIVAMLGSAGVAFALALQGSLSNCAGGILILVENLFKVGDYIIDATGTEGTVRRVDLFYTTIETLDGKIITLPNGSLSNGKLTNVTSTQHRRIELSVNIDYTADMDVARKLILDTLISDERVLQDMEMRVFVNKLDESSVNLSIWAWVRNEDYLRGSGDLLEKVKKALDKGRIKIPFPQMELHLYQDDTDDPNENGLRREQEQKLAELRPDSVELKDFR